MAPIVLFSVCFLPVPEQARVCQTGFRGWSTRCSSLMAFEEDYGLLLEEKKALEGNVYGKKTTCVGHWNLLKEKECTAGERNWSLWGSIVLSPSHTEFLWSCDAPTRSLGSLIPRYEPDDPESHSSPSRGISCALIE